jgi:Mn-dependent DtxR family transcriptional regulator
MTIDQLRFYRRVWRVVSEDHCAGFETIATRLHTDWRDVARAIRYLQALGYVGGWERGQRIVHVPFVVAEVGI